MSTIAEMFDKFAPVVEIEFQVMESETNPEEFAWYLLHPDTGVRTTESLSYVRARDARRGAKRFIESLGCVPVEVPSE